MNVSRSVGPERWRVAQEAEAQYWQFARQDDVELLRIMHEKASSMRWAARQIGSLTDVPGSWVEVGIGPLGIGCIHLVESGGRELVGLDPLPPIDIAPAALPTPISAVLAACRQEAYRHIVGKGESIDLPSATAGLVVCYNVLDHCEDPSRVIGEAARLLRPGGYLVLGCDVYSEAGRIKHRLRSALARATRTPLDTIGDLAHPHQLVARDLESLLRSAGFEIVAANTRRAELFRRFWGHSYRMLLIGRTPTS